MKLARIGHQTRQAGLAVVIVLAALGAGACKKKQQDATPSQICAKGLAQIQASDAKIEAIFDKLREQGGGDMPSTYHEVGRAYAAEAEVLKQFKLGDDPIGKKARAYAALVDRLAGLAERAAGNLNAREGEAYAKLVEGSQPFAGQRKALGAELKALCAQHQ